MYSVDQKIFIWDPKLVKKATKFMIFINLLDLRIPKDCIGVQETGLKLNCESKGTHFWECPEVS